MCGPEGAFRPASDAAARSSSAVQFSAARAPRAETSGASAFCNLGRGMEMEGKAPRMRRGGLEKSRIPPVPDENRKQVIASTYDCEKIPKTRLLTVTGCARIIGSRVQRDGHLGDAREPRRRTERGAGTCGKGRTGCACPVGLIGGLKRRTLLLRRVGGRKPVERSPDGAGW
jgi:hypothetical protein